MGSQTLYPDRWLNLSWSEDRCSRSGWQMLASFMFLFSRHSCGASLVPGAGRLTAFYLLDPHNNLWGAQHLQKGETKAQRGSVPWQSQQQWVGKC